MATDNFLNIDGTPLDTHDSLWDTMSGGDVANGEIFSNFCRPTGIWAACAAFYNNSQPADQESQAVFLATTALRYNRYVAARGSGSSQGYGLRFSLGSGANYTNLTITKNGSWFAQQTSSGAWAYASNHTLKVKVYGTSTTSIEGWVDGSQIGITRTDATSPITSGNPAFIASGDGTQENAIDDWTDNIAAGGGIVGQILKGKTMESLTLGRLIG